MQGELERAGEQWRLRFTRWIPHPPDEVWRAITEPQHLDAWFPHRIVGPWVVGGKLRFESEYGDFDGEVMRYESGSVVEFRWGTDTIRLEVAAAEKGTTLTLLDTFSELGKAARDAAGWHVCLDALIGELDGVLADGDTRKRWDDVHPGYADKFGPEASTLGPPE
jgi:uncharacterized protein YndB with AHSA1/START domain